MPMTRFGGGATPKTSAISVMTDWIPSRKVLAVRQDSQRFEHIRVVGIHGANLTEC